MSKSGSFKRRSVSVTRKYSPSAAGDDEVASGLAPAQVDLNNLKQEIFLKILVLGDLGVGKTSLVRKYTEDFGEGGNSGYKVSIDPGYNLKRLEVCII